MKFIIIFCRLISLVSKFLIPLLAAFSLPSAVEALPNNVNIDKETRNIYRLCASSIDYHKFIKSYAQNNNLININAGTKKTYLFSITNTGGDVHYNLNGTNIIPTNNLRQCQNLASKQEQYFNEVSTNMTGDFTLFYKCFNGVSEGYGNYKLYVTAQNRYSPINATLAGFPTYIIPMKGFNQCSAAKLQIDNLANQIQAKATGDYYPEFYTKCIRSPI